MRQYKQKEEAEPPQSRQNMLRSLRGPSEWAGQAAKKWAESKASNHGGTSDAATRLIIIAAPPTRPGCPRPVPFRRRSSTGEKRGKKRYFQTPQRKQPTTNQNDEGTILTHFFFLNKNKIGNSNHCNAMPTRVPTRTPQWRRSEMGHTWRDV